MHCPSCIVELKISDRQGVEIDYCPDCRGVWLDRGELDKIIERSLETLATPRYDEESRSRRRSRDEGERSGRRKRRKSFLEDLFDFD